MSPGHAGAFMPHNPVDELSRFFAGLTEQTFLQEFGLGETRVIGYLSDLLARFVSSGIHRGELFEVLESLRLIDQEVSS